MNRITVLVRRRTGVFARAFALRDFNVFNRINFASGVGSVAAGGVLSPNYNTCAESNGHCNLASGFGQVTDTIGDFNGAPGLGPGEPFNIQLAAKIVF